MIYTKFHNYVVAVAPEIRPVIRYLMLPIAVAATIVITTIDNIIEIAGIIIKGAK
jgi:hypothetical protein